MRGVPTSVIRLDSAVLGVVLAVALSGCATMNEVKGWFSQDANLKTAVAPIAPAQAAPAPLPPPAAKPKKQIREIRETKPPDRLASIDPDDLMGLDPPTVQKSLGAPARTDKSDMALVWTYRASECSLKIFFYPDIKTSSFHALKFSSVDGRGDQIDMAQPCIRAILQVKSNGAG